MRKAWHRLVVQLQDRGIHGPHLDRLRAHLSTEEHHDHLQNELHREIAQALGRAEAKVVAALLTLELADRDVDEAPTLQARAEALVAREQCRRNALQARSDYKIHREAVGLRRNRDLDALYPIPPPRRD